MGGICRDTDSPDAVHVGIVCLIAVMSNAGNSAIIGSAVSRRLIPAGPTDTHGAGAGVTGSNQVILLFGIAGGDQFHVEVHSGLELVAVNGGLVVLIDDPAAEGQQNGQEINDQVVLAVAAIDEAVLAGGLGGLADGHHVIQSGNAAAVKSGGGHILLVIQQNGYVAVVRSQIDVAVVVADGGGGGDNVVIEAVAHLTQVGQHAVGGELSHPGAIDHAQVVSTLLVHGVQGNLAVQIILSQVQDLTGHVVLSLESGQALLDDVGISAAAQNQSQLGGLSGSFCAGGAGVGGLFFLLAAAACGQRQDHDAGQSKCNQLFHFFSSKSF